MHNILKYVFYLSLNKVQVCALIHPVSCSNNIENKWVGKKGGEKNQIYKTDSIRSLLFDRWNHFKNK